MLPMLGLFRDWFLAGIVASWAGGGEEGESKFKVNASWDQWTLRCSSESVIVGDAAKETIFITSESWGHAGKFD